MLERGLEAAGYVVDAVGNGGVALDYLRTYAYELAVLDWRLPAMSGLEVVRELRRLGSRLPILLLTARDAASDRVAGLDGGADDYLVKPFDFAELLARMRALQRRPDAMLAPLVTVGDLAFDPASREVRGGGHSISLTGTELAILELMMRRSPSVVERQSIAVHVWAEEADALGSNTIEVHVARLRSKLKGTRAQVETVRGIGYRIVGR